MPQYQQWRIGNWAPHLTQFMVRSGLLIRALLNEPPSQKDQGKLNKDHFSSFLGCDNENRRAENRSLQYTPAKRCPFVSTMQPYPVTPPVFPNSYFLPVFAKRLSIKLHTKNLISHRKTDFQGTFRPKRPGANDGAGMFSNLFTKRESEVFDFEERGDYFIAQLSYYLLSKTGLFYFTRWLPCKN